MTPNQFARLNEAIGKWINGELQRGDQVLPPLLLDLEARMARAAREVFDTMLHRRQMTMTNPQHKREDAGSSYPELDRVCKELEAAMWDTLNDGELTLKLIRQALTPDTIARLAREQMTPFERDLLERDLSHRENPAISFFRKIVEVRDEQS